MELLIGAFGALAVCVFGSVVGLDRDRAFYPVMMIVIAAYYLLFAVMGGSRSALIQDGLVMAVFVAIAVLGFKTNLGLVVVALLAHGVLDLFHGHLIANPGAPAWWPPFCLTFDVVAAGYLAMRLRRSSAGEAAEDNNVVTPTT